MHRKKLELASLTLSEGAHRVKTSRAKEKEDRRNQITQRYRDLQSLLATE